MEYINFEWDEEKNQTNKIKHGIDFEEAATVFYDDDNIIRIISARKATKSETKTYIRYAGGEINERRI